MLQWTKQKGEVMISHSNFYIPTTESKALLLLSLLLLNL